MYCPRCGDALKEQQGVFRCERGKMEVSRFIAQRLYLEFVSKTEESEDFRFTEAPYRFGGQWFCPGCGIPMDEEQPGAIKCLQCGRNLGKYVHQLVELHPHTGQ